MLRLCLRPAPVRIPRRLSPMLFDAPLDLRVRHGENTLHRALEPLPGFRAFCSSGGGANGVGNIRRSVAVDVRHCTDMSPDSGRPGGLVRTARPRTRVWGHAIAEAGPDKPPVPGLLDTDAQAVSA